MKACWFLICCAAISLAQSRELLTLEEAERIALKNHPAIEASRYESEAAGERVKQFRSAYYPQATASLTAVGADDATRVAAGSLNNPVVYSRLGTGVTVSQTLLDFGRTSHLVESSRAAADAVTERIRATAADVVLNVRRAYFGALRADTVLTVAKATLEARQVVVDQTSELVKADLKSSLDLSFAQTNLAEAKLLIASAENERRAARASLAQALGRQDFNNTDITDVASAPLDPLALTEFQRSATLKRPELLALRSELRSARQFSDAERALKYPTFALTGTMGYVPTGVSAIPSTFGAAGLNIGLPFFNGGLYKARQAEAGLRARALDRRIADAENRVARDVSVAWLDVNTASERIPLTRQYVDQATQAVELAQARYELGLGTMVELSQAQLVQTNAQIQFTTATYDYQIRRALLDYAAGLLQ
ncbi:MAG: TolC family protein [Bryobacteraceae bacterium]|nr:TolC family protein [Bryobacteraceae bacterium]